MITDNFPSPLVFPQLPPILSSLSSLFPILDEHSWLTYSIVLAAPFFLPLLTKGSRKPDICSGSQLPWQPGRTMRYNHGQWNISGNKLGSFWGRFCVYIKGTEVRGRSLVQRISLSFCPEGRHNVWVCNSRLVPGRQPALGWKIQR